MTPANQSTPEVTFDIRRNPESIWLSPICDDTADHGDGRTWASPAPEEVCEDPECGEPWVRYVREDLASPARGGDELRATAQFLSDRLDDLEWMDVDLESTLRDFMGHVDPAHARLKSALASTDMAGAGERAAIVAFLRRQSDIGANRGNKAEKGTTKRAAYGGGSLALHRAADAIEAGEHLTNDNTAAPPVEGLTSGEGWQLVPIIPTEEMIRAGENAGWDAGNSMPAIRAYARAYAAMLAASPKATATASVRETLARAIDPEAFEPTDNYDQRISRDMRRAEAYSAADRVRALTHSGTAATIGGERA